MSQLDCQTISKILERRLDELLIEKEPLSQAMRYALLGPGKRLRPRLVIAAAMSFGGTLEQALDPACAIEMIHAYSLVHDDLPCMDDDDERRGRPTVHRAFDEATALLAGDGLLTEAFGVLARAPIAPVICLQLIELLSKRSGYLGMALGQVIDLSKPKNRADILQMYRRKTGDLLSCSLEFGALLAAPHQLSEMRRLGLELGLAFQLRDDLEDGQMPMGPKDTEELMKRSATSLAELPLLVRELISPLFPTCAMC